MIRPIMKNEAFLSLSSDEATASDLPVAHDLLDTLLAHRHECVGMAANMIGQRKRIIAIEDNGTYRVMLNPQIMKSSGPYQTEEGCLSLKGRRPCQRFKRITVRYQDPKMVERIERFDGFTAQVIQHELDHFEGILI